MSWQQFQFKLRFFQQKVNQGLTLGQAEKDFEQSELTNLYAKSKLSGAPKALFERLFLIADRESIKRTMSILADIDMSASFSDSSVHKRILSKLGYLTALLTVFVIVTSVYRFYVYPIFATLSDSYAGLTSEYFGWIPNIWLLTTLLAIVALTYCISLQRSIQNMDKVVTSRIRKSSNWLLPKGIRNEIEQLQHIFAYTFDSNVSSDLAHTMKTVKDNGLDEAEEVPRLLRFSLEMLALQLSQYAKRLFNLSFAAMAVAIGFFLIQIYDPIFNLGALLG